MSESDDLSIECATCVAAGTTACGDCVVTHLLANDDGPIEFVVAPVVTPTDRAVGWFVAAGLVNDPPDLVERAEFDRPEFDRPGFAEASFDGAVR